MFQERDQVTPEAVGGKLGHHALDVAHRQRGLEVGEPGVDPLLRGHGVGGFQDLSHVS